MDTALPVLLICVALIVLFSTVRRHAFAFLILKRKRKLKENKENDTMSKMLEDLMGKEVRITDIILGSTNSGTVVEIDEKWLKLEKKNKKGELVSTKIIAIESIGDIEIK